MDWVNWLELAVIVVFGSWFLLILLMTARELLRRRSEPRPAPRNWLIGPWELCREHPHCLVQKQHRFSAIPTSSPTSSEATDSEEATPHG